MKHLKKWLDTPRNGHALLEMPSGTGKTVTILSFIAAYLKSNPHRNKLVYCTRTVPEVDKTLIELKRVIQYRQTYDQHEKFLGIGLSSRRNLCIHPEVSQSHQSIAVDSGCHSRTASWIRQDPNAQHCDFFEALERKGRELMLPSGVYTLQDIKEYGQRNQICPYFLARNMISAAQVIVYSYYYLLDPKISEIISSELGKECIIIFDEAHNIDNVCIDTLSVDINRQHLDSGTHSLEILNERLDQIKLDDRLLLQEEYQRLVSGVKKQQESTFPFGSPVLSEDMLQEAVPGNIRKAEHFLAFLKRWIEYLKTRLHSMYVIRETPIAFLQHVKQVSMIEQKSLRFSSERLTSLVKVLSLTDVEKIGSMFQIVNFATIIATFANNDGFAVLMEPPDESLGIQNPVLHLICMDASIIMKTVLNRFQNVLLTSGTISPLDMYPKILDFVPIMTKHVKVSMPRSRSVFPMIVTRGSDQLPMSSRFETRQDPSVIRNYGQLILELSQVTPDGMVVFFPSYRMMENLVTEWDVLGLLSAIVAIKLVFLETQDPIETCIALKNYRDACDSGRGAILFCVARGKVSEGIDFEHHYGRSVILMGIPFQYTESRVLQTRLEFLSEKYSIKEGDFLTFDAMRQAAQCLGRVLRGKSDYGLMILADKRFARSDKIAKLPSWISSNDGGEYDISEDRASGIVIPLSTDMAVSQSRQFFRQMGQPLEHSEQLGITLYSNEHIKKLQNISTI